MKVYINVPNGLSRAMTRVENALRMYAPTHIHFVNDEAAADFVLLHVIGYPETVEAVERVTSRNQKYGIIQYCLRSTQMPSCLPWAALWAGAEVVWSYYDLPGMAKDDGIRVDSDDPINFYISPLGVDHTVFYKKDFKRGWTILTSGYVPESEGVLEAERATGMFDLPMFHLGPGDVRFGKHVTQSVGIADKYLCDIYNRCQWVAGLRRDEGFELPAAEGLLCGARPIMFDRPHYRRWFDGFAEFIPEGSFDKVVEALVKVFTDGQHRRPVSDGELERAKELFSWKRIVSGFWESFAPSQQIRMGAERRRLLWVGDAVVSSGFARATHHILDRVKDVFDVTVLGLNFQGDPGHGYPYPIYPVRALWGGDYLGTDRLPSLIKEVKPDVVMFQNDPWNIPAYVNSLRRAEVSAPLLAGAIAVDGKNTRGNLLNDLDFCVFWTKFGEHEARMGGFRNLSAVVPLGVDLSVYKPVDRLEAIREMGLPDRLQSAFIIGNVNRNQPRKRLDLMVLAFNKWVNTYAVKDAWLFMHVAPTGDPGWNIEQLMQTLGFNGENSRLILSSPPVGVGVTEHELALTYSVLSAQINCGQGEGFGLTTIEGMACGAVQIVSNNAALGEWTGDAAYKLPCPNECVTPGGINVIGSVSTVDHIVEAFNTLYRSPRMRDELRQRGFELANKAEYRWENIGQAYVDLLNEAIDRKAQSKTLQPELATVGVEA